MGPTGTGKTALALDLARTTPDHYELVSVDAMAVYRHLDVGTAKPTAAEQLVAPWHLIDIVDPSEEFSVAAFQAEARQVLAGIDARGHVPLLVGGTGLYHRAVLDGLEIPGRFPDEAAELERRAEQPGGLAELFSASASSTRSRQQESSPPIAAGSSEPSRSRSAAVDPSLRSGRAWSRTRRRERSSSGSSSTAPSSTAGWPRASRTSSRRGFLDEVRALSTRPAGLSRTARQAIGYRELLRHLEEGVPLEQAKAESVRRLRAFARRQEAWFKRDPRVIWIRADRNDLGDAVRARLGDTAMAKAARH